MVINCNSKKINFVILQDGTTLTDVASDLKQMQVIDALGTSVDEAGVPSRKDGRYQVLFMNRCL